MGWILVNIQQIGRGSAAEVLLVDGLAGLIELSMDYLVGSLSASRAPDGIDCDSLIRFLGTRRSSRRR